MCLRREMQTACQSGAQLRLQSRNLLAVDSLGGVSLVLQPGRGALRGRPNPFDIQIEKPVDPPIEIELRAERQSSPQIAALKGQRLKGGQMRRPLIIRPNTAGV